MNYLTKRPLLNQKDYPIGSKLNEIKEKNQIPTPNMPTFKKYPTSPNTNTRIILPLLKKFSDYDY